MVRTTLLFALLIPACSNSPGSPVGAIPVASTITAPSLSAPVDVVRDEWGIPHIYGARLEDVAYAEGYLMGQDRLVQLDLIRHSASGTLAEIGGKLAPSLIDSDINMRLHHLHKTSEDAFTQLTSSADPADTRLVATLTSFAAGVNAYVADLQAGNYSLPPELALAYDPSTWKAWTEADSLTVGKLISFQLSFDADSDVARSALQAAASVFAGTPRAGFATDLEMVRPVDATYTLPGGWSQLLSETSVDTMSTPSSALALLRADRPSIINIGRERFAHPSIGSNDWVVGPQLSATGHTLIANDPHLGLQNPATFYLVHLVASDPTLPVDVMGAQFPGVPGVILGMNRHVAWGATTSNLDVTDVYQETISACAAGSTAPCATWNGQSVPLVPRTETFGVGRFGTISQTITVQFWDVPHHGPILPRITTDHNIEPLGSQELSVRWTGHEPSLEVRALLGLDTSKSVAEARAALERDFRVGGQNWVLGDDQGHFGWTETVRVPRRPANVKPWLVVPGDGSADWTSDLDPAYIPHAFDPAQGFLATANGDPIGVTDSNDVFANAPVVDGVPVYLGSDWDPGTRVGRITKRLSAMSQKGPLTLDDLQAIQADAVTEYGQALQPTMLDAARALEEEIQTPGTHADLEAIASTADQPSKNILPDLITLIQGWSFDTPSATPGEAPSDAQIADSRAALLFAVWETRFAEHAFEDEFAAMGDSPGDEAQLKVLIAMCNNPGQLATGIDPATGDSILFSDMSGATPTPQSKRLVAAQAVLDTIDYLYGLLGPDQTVWRWGDVHTLTLVGLLPLAPLQIPLATDPQFSKGYPRHGDNGTVDVGHHGLDPSDFTYADGPNVRFVCELAPDGPHARNVIPGGEAFDPHSPHYRDLFDLWRQNQTIDLAFTDADVVASAQKEVGVNGGGRVRFAPR